jgi:glycine cleavage system H lipoate-binding protein
MACPFLRETRVRFCHAAPVRKMIAGTQPGTGDGRCSSPAYTDCKTARTRADVLAGAESCPFLDEKLVCYCDAAPVPRFIPYSDPCGRCGTDGYRYCESWLRMARGGVPEHSPEALISRLHTPPDLLYAPNHTWLDVSSDGSCYVGLDALFADVLGRVERISFVTLEGRHRPSAVVTARGIDWPVVFPREMLIADANVYLRHAPERLTTDPYGTGWLFEGTATSDTADLARGSEAAAWMAAEGAKITTFVHGLSNDVLNDGGTLACGFAEHLSREQLLGLLNAFFAPHLEVRRIER